MQNNYSSAVADYFRVTGLRFADAPVVGLIQEQNRFFVDLIGVKWHICAIIWEMIYPDLFTQNGPHIKREHLLWCLVFLKNYSKNSRDAKICKTTYKTFSKWVWIVMTAIADIESDVVSSEF